MNVAKGDLARIVQVEGDPIDPCAGMIVVVEEYLGDELNFNGQIRHKCWKVCSIAGMFPWGSMYAAGEDRCLRRIDGLKDNDVITDTIIVNGTKLEAVMAVLS